MNMNMNQEISKDMKIDVNNDSIYKLRIIDVDTIKFTTLKLIPDHLESFDTGSQSNSFVCSSLTDSYLGILRGNLVQIKKIRSFTSFKRNLEGIQNILRLIQSDSKLCRNSCGLLAGVDGTIVESTNSILTLSLVSSLPPMGK